MRRRVRNPALYVAVGVLVGQVLLGALNVWLGKHPGLIVAHLALGTVLWGTMVYAASLLTPASAPVRDRARSGKAATEAATA